LISSFVLLIILGVVIWNYRRKWIESEFDSYHTKLLAARHIADSYASISSDDTNAMSPEKTIVRGFVTVLALTDESEIPPTVFNHADSRRLREQLQRSIDVSNLTKDTEYKRFFDQD
ncbi:MAG: hypothetical protein CUN57_02740, partial [Phototrophicales bacterium]